MSWTTSATARVAAALTPAATRYAEVQPRWLSAQVIGAAATIAPSWPSVPLSEVRNGIRRPVNQLLTSRSRQIQVIASPAPTKIRAATAAPYDSASANPACASVSVTAPVSITARGPNRSTSRPTGTCMPAYTSSWSVVNVASCAALMSNRSAAVRPATARLERWKIART